ncbi:MAG: hypothetical protein M3Y04_06415 [Actinomycetota bacterium]|nr:hypothetical protein [Actinomycetota bacterium]
MALPIASTVLSKDPQEASMAAKPAQPVGVVPDGQVQRHIGGVEVGEPSAPVTGRRIRLAPAEL